MRTCITALAIVLVAAIAAGAQDAPRVETFVGYTYQRVNSATDVPAFSANGGSGQVGVNFNKYIGFFMDMGAVHNGNINEHHTDTTMSHYLFGPRVSLRYSRIRPYFQTLFGGAHAGTSIRADLQVPPQATQPIYDPSQPTVPVRPGQAITARLVGSQTAFGMAIGGGLDLKINNWVSFRPIGLDYFMTRLQNFRSGQDNNQHQIRYTTGFNFTFGEAQ